jgi:hypothetical protein
MAIFIVDPFMAKSQPQEFQDWPTERVLRARWNSPGDERIDLSYAIFSVSRFFASGAIATILPDFEQ